MRTFLTLGSLSRRLGVSVAAGLLLVGAGSASADPPGWAPAHGYRAHHGYAHDHYPHKRKKHRYKHRHKHRHEHYHRAYHEPVYVERVYLEPVYVEQVVVHRNVHVQQAAPPPPVHPGYPAGHRGPDGMAGGLVGAAAGGLLGAQVGGGDGRLAATAAGTLAGYLIGREVARGRYLGH